MNLKKVFKSFVFAARGVRILISSENNFQFHFVAMFAVIALSWYMDITTTEWLFVLLCIALVFSSEAINTAMEKLCDKVEPKFSKEIGQVKDVAAAAVLLAALFAAICACIIFIPKFL